MKLVEETTLVRTPYSEADEIQLRNIPSNAVDGFYAVSNAFPRGFVVQHEDAGPGCPGPDWDPIEQFGVHRRNEHLGRFLKSLLHDVSDPGRHRDLS